MRAAVVPVWDEAGIAIEGRPVLVLLHGIGGGKQGFAPQVKQFADWGYRVLAWDMPGYGGSAMIEPYDFDGLAKALLRMLDQAQVNQAVLIGHSMGGMVAQQAWTLSPSALPAW